MKILGIDIGSRIVKIAAFNEEHLIASKMIDTAVFYREYCSNIDNKIQIDFERLNMGRHDKIVSTGYGRNNVNISGAEVIVELKAHAYGAMWQTGQKNLTLLDIGGQDSKVILIKNGKMTDMILNDKCAASCGRYLENMANVLGIRLTELEKYSQDPVQLNSTCAVFSESELIGRISEGYSIAQLAAGVNYSLYKRIRPLIERFKNDLLVITGGVALNTAIVGMVKKESGFPKVIVPEHPQLNGAIGCFAYAVSKKG